MKRIILLAVLVVAFFLMPSYSYPSYPGGVHLSLIDGDVKIYMEDTAEWVDAEINMPLKEGDRIWVPGECKAELRLNDGSSLRLTGDSSLDILRIEERSFRFFLDTGRAYVNFRGLNSTLLQLDTPLSSTRVYEMAIYRVDAPAESYTDISVDRGVVYAETKVGSMRVREGYTLSIRGDDYADLYPMEPSDEWYHWNKERDRALYERQYSTRYLPDELSLYSYDFDRYGRWIYVRDYGYVWRPSVVISAGWAPYRHGRWIWIGGDFIWVSYEPWGWVPYHYGRWIFNISIGWCWVPPARGAVYWGPGFVGWVYTPEYIAWVPLAPGEIYYGYGYYGPHSVNITNVNIANIKIKKVYKNVYVNNAVTVVEKDSFTKGKHKTIYVKDNPFLKDRISIGRPQIKMVRERTHPAMSQIHGMKKPSSKIKDIVVDELKKEHPLVNTKIYSVMSPGSSIKEMPIKREKVIAQVERRMQKRDKQDFPMEKEKVLLERKSSKPFLSQKEADPVNEKVVKTGLGREVKEHGLGLKKETEGHSKNKVSGEKEIVSPHPENFEHREIYSPNDRRTKLQNERKMRVSNERQLIEKRESMQNPIQKRLKTEKLGQVRF